MHRLASVFLVLLAVAAGSVAARAEKRVALVIGNAAYQYTTSLANPANDADDMALALKKVGFEVIAVKNVDKRSLEMAMVWGAPHTGVHSKSGRPRTLMLRSTGFPLPPE
jgi:hypothetical protein